MGNGLDIETHAWVLHPDIKTDYSPRSAVDALAEAVALAHALPGLSLMGETVVRLPRAHPGKLFGKGKIAELGDLFKGADVELVLVDGHVSPVQQRNLEKDWGVKILDRTGLILEIFSDRARTREGVLQVEMAALSYQRTRLVRAWTHLERQRGGLGFVGGPGETQVESDKRAIDIQLVRLQKQLDKVGNTRKLHRTARAKVPYPIVALVGYTNAGKSTLFNHMTGAKVFAKDMLFATLDPTMRALELPNGMDIILSDTVGFISDLPTELVASFRATLEEVTAADLVVHVRDISHPETLEQAKDVETILETLGLAQDVPKIELWNKTDILDEGAIETLINSAERAENVFMISALTGVGIPEFLRAVSLTLTPDKSSSELLLSYSEGKQRARLFDQGIVTAERQTDDGYAITVLWTARQKKVFMDQYLPKLD
ncbi:MAG TPA: GTPase HflX [Rhodobacteraceae bacterium]|nr:GTPase HflX [Paracoccaceae bacterium]